MSAAGAPPCAGPRPGDASLTRLGPAVEGFPVNSAARLDRVLFIASMDLSPLRLLRYDLAAGRVTGQASLGATTRVWRMVASDGGLYLGLWNVAAPATNFVRYDPATGRFTDLPRIPARMEFAALAAGPRGTLYAASDRPEVVFAFDPAAGRLTEVRFADSPANYPGALAATADHLYIGTRGERAGLYEHDLRTGRTRSILPPAAAGAGGIGSITATRGLVVAGTTGGPARVVVLGAGDAHVIDVPGEVAVETSAVDAGRQVWFAGKPSGTLYRYDPATRSLATAARPVPDSPVRHVDVVDGTVVGVSAAETVWRHDPRTGATATTDLLAAGAPAVPLAVMSLAVRAGRVYAGGNNRLQIRTLESGTVERVVIVGEPKDMEAGRDDILLAMYPYAQLRVYDPASGRTRVLTSWDPDHNRPRDLALAGPKRVLIGTRVDATGGGGLVSHHRGAGDTTVHRDPLGPRRAVTCVTADAAQRMYLGSDGSTAVVGAWHTATGRLRWQATPVRGGGSVTGLVVHAGRVWGLTQQGWLFALDPADGSLVATRRVLDPPAGELGATTGALYAVSRDAVVRIDPGAATAEVVVEGLDAHLFERPRLAIDDDCALYVIAGTDLARIAAGRPG